MAVSTGIAAIVFSVFGASASAQVWNNTTGDGNWLNGDNWVGGVAPTGIADDATVGAPSPATLNGSVNLNSLTVTADGIVNVNGGLNLDFGGTATTTLNNAGTINTGNNSDFQFQNSVFNSGNININAGANSTDIEIDSVGATLDGGGTITLSGGLAGINGVGGSTLTIVDQTIQGQGSIGENAIGIVNQAGGLINANVDGEILTIDVTAAAGAVNAGTLQASDSGVLRVLGSVVDNSGGLIEAGADSTVSFNNSTITGGTLNSVGTGELVVECGTNAGFVDVTNNGSIVSLNNSDTEVSGTITNTGTIELQAGANSTDLEVQSAATLTGGGTVRLSGGNAGINGTTGSTLTIGDQTIEGQGNIGENAIGIVNQADGLIDANVGGETLTIDANATGAVNAGTLQASDSGVLRVLGSAVDNTGGQIIAQDASEVSFNNSTITGGTLNSVGTGELVVECGTNAGFVDVTNNGSIVSLNNSDTEVSGTITNTGTIELQAGANSTDLEVQSAATLTGGGTVRLSGGNAGINGTTGSTLTIGDQTIEGQGNIGENAIGIVNSSTGLIDANVDGGTLTIDANAAGGVVNEGTLQASGSGNLQVLGSVVDNSGGLIEAGADSTVSFNNSTITGGTLNSVGTGELVVECGTNAGFVDVTNNGSIVSLNNSDTEVSGTITNTGTIELQAGANSTDLEVQSVGATLTGGGTVRLSGGLAGINGVSGGVLDIQSQIVIGEGNLGENAIDIINGVGGTIEADVDGASLTINTSSSLFSNAGTLRASNGATLNVLEDVFNSGIIETAVDSTFEALSLENGVDSLVTGNGIIDVGSGPIDIAGVLAPGGTVGTLTALDDVVLASTAEFQTELLSDSLFDVFSVEGDLELGGILSVELISDFDPLSTDSFLIASTTGDVTGAFSNVANGGLLLTEGGEGTFTVNFGGSSVILSNFTLAAVPEPSAALCLVGLGFGLLARRRRQV